MIKLLVNSPDWVQIAFWSCFSVGLIVLFRFWRIVLVVGTGAVAIYIAITSKFKKKG